MYKFSLFLIKKLEFFSQWNHLVVLENFQYELLLYIYFLRDKLAFNNINGATKILINCCTFFFMRHLRFFVLELIFLLLILSLFEFFKTGLLNYVIFIKKMLVLSK